MPYLDTYTTPLTAKTAAHLLRRATFGPTQQEIADFTGITATEAVQRLISNVSKTINAAPPVDLEPSSPTYGQPFLTQPYSFDRRIELSHFVGFWWAGLMCEQNNSPSLLEKLTAFWQNHFVVALGTIGEYRLLFQYLQTLRKGCLGSFKEMTIQMTKDGGMLLYQNGNENEKDHPNENYARELQELFTVGQKNFEGAPNYTEDDVKAAARILTGWRVNSDWAGETPANSVYYTPSRHDTSDKTFSSYYGNRVIQGRTGSTGGDIELRELIDMLLLHPEAARFICRKLYRWYINHNVTQEIENNVIIPLASFFSSAENNFQIQPVLVKLLTSQVFYDVSNIGSMIKSPSEFLVGALRFFNQPVPDRTTQIAGYRKYMEFVYWGMSGMQLRLLDQPAVFGSPPYYQIGFSKNWINGATLILRSAHMDELVYPNRVIHPGYILGIDLMGWVKTLQPNFDDVDGTPAIACEVVYEAFTKNLFAVEIGEAQKNYLIDTIMMEGMNRSYWKGYFNAYRRNPADSGALFMVTRLMRYLTRMAEYQIF
jgi:uncharacterized protein (DUF1800 family)